MEKLLFDDSKYECECECKLFTVAQTALKEKKNKKSFQQVGSDQAMMAAP